MFFSPAAIAAPVEGTVTVAGEGPDLQNGEDPPVDLEADRVVHDEDAQTITAMGNVELIQSGRIYKADSISYNLQTDVVRAEGHVVMSEEDGTTYFADHVDLTKDMKNGFVKGLQVLLADGSRFTAEEGKRTNGTVIELKRASYTPCEPCKEDPSRPPLWQIRAAEVVHDEKDKSIKYKDAWFEFAGVPVAYSPYFIHGDGSEKQKSGFLTPTVGFNSTLGASYQQQYYWAVAPDRDATFGTVVSTDANPVALAEYRQRFENAKVQVNGSATYSDRTDDIAGRAVHVKEEARGHLFADGLWDMNEKWRSGMKVRVASDDQYLRQYNIESDDVLENEVYAERFSGRNYMVGRAMAFQDVRVSTRQTDQPAVLPEMIASFYGDPNGVLGGRWNAQLSTLGLYRKGNGQDVARASTVLGWQRRFVSGTGLVSTLDTNVRGDVYGIDDRPTDLYPNEPRDTAARGFAYANLENSYPLVKRFDASQVVVSPMVAVTGATNIDNNSRIPNEDSQDFTLDATNLFEPNRSPGYDLIEDQSHATYGVRTGWYGDEGDRTEVFFGQSYRFDNGDNPFAAGSGLATQGSDYVGQVSAMLANFLTFDYRFQLDNENLSPHRHDLDAALKLGQVDVGARYFFIDAIEGTDLDETREQIQPWARWRFYDDWSMFGSAWYDFGQDSGLRTAAYGLDYNGQCMTFNLTAERTLTEESTGDSGTEIMFRIGFKNLGEFESSGISIGGGDSSSSKNTTTPVSSGN